MYVIVYIYIIKYIFTLLSYIEPDLGGIKLVTKNKMCDPNFIFYLIELKFLCNIILILVLKS